MSNTILRYVTKHMIKNATIKENGSIELAYKKKAFISKSRAKRWIKSNHPAIVRLFNKSFMYVNLPYESVIKDA